MARRVKNLEKHTKYYVVDSADFVEEVDFYNDKEYSEFYYEDDICCEFKKAQLIAKESCYDDIIEFYSTKTNNKLFSLDGYFTDILIMPADLKTELNKAILGLLKKVKNNKISGKIGWIFYNQNHVVGVSAPYDASSRRITSMNILAADYNGVQMSNAEILAKYIEKAEQVFFKVQKAAGNIQKDI